MHSTTIRRQLKEIQRVREMRERSEMLAGLAECNRTEEERDADLRREAEELWKQFCIEEI